MFVCIFARQNKEMAVVRLDNIRPEMLRWAFERAGFNEVGAITVFPKLAEWLSGDKKPTSSQLQTFAKKFHTPFGYLFLSQPPEENIPIPMFRGKAGRVNFFDIDLYDTVLNIQSRQDWLEEYLRENDIETCNLVGCINLNTPLSKTITILRRALSLEARWAFSIDDFAPAVNILTQQIEENGIFVVFNGVVGNNSHRPLEVNECRGFALVNEIAPFIFINSRDSKSAQLFTLIHEVVHIMLGISAGHAGESEISHDITELYCDKVAAEFLVPANTLHELWNNNIKNLSRRFKVSELVIARRAHDIGLLNDSDYRLFWLEYSSRPIPTKKKSNGGDYYRTSTKRVGRTFAIHVRNAVKSRQLSYTEAYRLTGLYGKTYQHFMSNNV